VSLNFIANVGQSNSKDSNVSKYNDWSNVHCGLYYSLDFNKL